MFVKNTVLLCLLALASACSGPIESSGETAESTLRVRVTINEQLALEEELNWISTPVEPTGLESNAEGQLVNPTTGDVGELHETGFTIFHADGTRMDVELEGEGASEVAEELLLLNLVPTDTLYQAGDGLEVAQQGLWWVVVRIVFRVLFRAATAAAARAACMNWIATAEARRICQDRAAAACGGAHRVASSSLSCTSAVLNRLWQSDPQCTIQCR